jgi:hypothetical protein
VSRCAERARRSIFGAACILALPIASASCTLQPIAAAQFACTAGTDCDASTSKDALSGGLDALASDSQSGVADADSGVVDASAEDAEAGASDGTVGDLDASMADADTDAQAPDAATSFDAHALAILPSTRGRFGAVKITDPQNNVYPCASAAGCSFSFPPDAMLTLDVTSRGPPYFGGWSGPVHLPCNNHACQTQLSMASMTSTIIAYFEDGLLAYYPFDQPALQGDASGAGRATPTIAAPFNAAVGYRFGGRELPDGNMGEGVTVPFALTSTVGSNPLYELSVCAALRSIDTLRSANAVVMRDASDVSIFRLGLSLTAATGDVRLNDGITYGATGGRTGSPSGYSLVCVVLRSGVEVAIYLDCAPVASEVVPLAFLYATQGALRIGTEDQCGNMGCFKGDIDEVKIWSRALTPGELCAEVTR